MTDIPEDIRRDARAVCTEAFCDDPPELGPHPLSCPCCAIVARALLAERERCLAVVDEWRDHYPRDVFPDNATSITGKTGRFARVMLTDIRLSILDPERPKGAKP